MDLFLQFMELFSHERVDRNGRVLHRFGAVLRASDRTIMETVVLDSRGGKLGGKSFSKLTHLHSSIRSNTFFLFSDPGNICIISVSSSRGFRTNDV